MVMWPVEERLSKVLGTSQGLTGQIRMRWALKTDVKERGARKKSTYYQKHEPQIGAGPSKRRREDDGSLQSRLDVGPNDRRARERELAALDAELDNFASGEPVPSPPSAEESRPSLADRLAAPARADRPVVPLPRRSKGWERREGGGRRDRAEKAPIDKDSLDAELDAFLNHRDQ
jgi:hypothetical protein